MIFFLFKCLNFLRKTLEFKNRFTAYTQTTLSQTREKTWKRYLNAFAGILQETTYSRVTHKIVKFTNSRLMKEHFHDHANISIHAFTRKKRSIHEFTT